MRSEQDSAPDPRPAAGPRDPDARATPAGLNDDPHAVAGGNEAGWLQASPRSVPFARTIRTSLRTLHIASIAVLYGGAVYSVEGPALWPAFVAALLTGGSLAAFEAWQAPIWLVQVRGAATAAKLFFALAALLDPGMRVGWLSGALVVGSVTSHMPGRYRYFSLLHGRVVKAGEKG